MTLQASRAEAPVDADTPWDQVVRKHFTGVYRRAYRLTRNRQDAEDLTQEVFIRVFRSLATYTPGTFEGWLYRITVNLFRDQISRDRRVWLDELREDTLEPRTARQHDPEQLCADKVLDNDIRDALADLPAEYRTALLLRDIDGLAYEEIANVLGIKCGTVGSRIHRGRAQLRAALSHRAKSAQRTAVPQPRQALTAVARFDARGSPTRNDQRFIT